MLWHPAQQEHSGGDKEMMDNFIPPESVPAWRFFKCGYAERCLPSVHQGEITIAPDSSVSNWLTVEEMIWMIENGGTLLEPYPR